MDAFDLMAMIHDRMDTMAREILLPPDEHVSLDHEDGFKTWPELDREEVGRVGRSLAALFGITLDESEEG
jgi:hypothetical protein